MFKKGQLVRDKFTGNLFTVIEPNPTEANLMWFGFVRVNSVDGYGEGLIRECDLEIISNNFKFKWAK